MIMKVHAKSRLTATVVTADLAPDRLKQLTKLGYYVEDMGKAYGSEFKGQYRWMNRKTEDFQDDEESPSKSEAWKRADEHAKENGK